VLKAWNTPVLDPRLGCGGVAGRKALLAGAMMPLDVMMREGDRKIA
jgi:hypothetical protein